MAMTSFMNIIREHANEFVSDCIANGFTIDKKVHSSNPKVYKLGLTKDIGDITVTIINRGHEIQVKRHYNLKATGHKNQVNFIYKKVNADSYELISR